MSQHTGTNERENRVIHLRQGNTARKALAIGHNNSEQPPKLQHGAEESNKVMMDEYELSEALYIGKSHAIVDLIDSSLSKVSQSRRYQNLSTHEPQTPHTPKTTNKLDDPSCLSGFCQCGRSHTAKTCSQRHADLQKPMRLAAMWAIS